MQFIEDLTIGARTVLGRHTFTADEIKAFALKFDPQPFHLDEAAAANSPFGALCASGWHTVAVWMRLNIDHQQRADAARRARGEPIAELGLSPGFRELRWLKPVYVGDTISYAAELTAKRLSGSRPGWGLITLRNTGANQNDEPVLSFVSTAFVQSRGPATEDGQQTE
jgi:acyl dehydratase